MLHALAVCRAWLSPLPPVCACLAPLGQLPLDEAYHALQMADLAQRALYPIDLIFAGIPCPHFSCSQTVGPETNEAERWREYDELIEMLKANPYRFSVLEYNGA